MDLQASFETKFDDERGELSFYEDALDDMDEEARTLQRDTAMQVRRIHSSLRHRPPPLVTMGRPAPSASRQPSSASENSSIEKIGTGEGFRSRKGTNSLRRRSNKSNNSSSNSNNGHDDDWKQLNFTFQEAASYPLLFQLNQQLQTISSQLNEVASANALHLKLMHRLLYETVLLNRRRQSYWYYFTRFFFFWLPLMTVPFICRLAYKFYTARRLQFGRVLLKYM